MSLWTASIVKDSHILTVIYFIFLQKRPRQNLKIFQYQSWTSVNWSEKQLSSKTVFSNVFQLNRSKFMLNLC